MKTFLTTLSMVALAAVAGAQTRLAYVPLDESCRMIDTRVTGDALKPGVVRAMNAADLCGVPFEAKALEANVTATGAKGTGFLSLLRARGRVPQNPALKTSLLNFAPGQDVANAALISLGEPIEHWGGVFWMVAGVSGTDVVVDVTGYYLAIP